MAGKQRAFGFKFIIPPAYPSAAPLVYLDEKEDAQIIDLFDYLEKGNRIVNLYITEWAKYGKDAAYNGGPIKYNLITLSTQVYNLFNKAPPLPFEEL